MFILEGCGWIPNATVNFIANIVDIIKIFVPILLIIMGAIEFGKAVMAQQEDQIKKSQTAFIQKLIAGAAVFFVIVLVGWILKIINNADSSLYAGDALNCITLMFNGGYQADIIETPNNTTTTKKNNQNNPIDEFYSEQCKQTYYITLDAYKETEEGKKCNSQFWIDHPFVSLFETDPWYECFEANIMAPYKYCVNQEFNDQISAENNNKATCMAQASCTNIDNCPTCRTSLDLYLMCKNQWSSYGECTIDYEYLNDKESFMQACQNNGSVNGVTTGCSKMTANSDKRATCCENEYTTRLTEKQSCITNHCKSYETSMTRWYCTTYSDQC